MTTKISLPDIFKENICSFDVAKKAKEAGMTCANTYYTYDASGGINDGGWLEAVGAKDLFPAINLPYAIGMLEYTSLDFDKIECSLTDKVYSFKYKDETYESKNLVDILVTVWIKYKN